MGKAAQKTFFFSFSKEARLVGVVRGIFITILQHYTILLMYEARTIFHVVVQWLGNFGSQELLI